MVPSDDKSLVSKRLATQIPILMMPVDVADRDPLPKSNWVGAVGVHVHDRIISGG